MMFELNFLNDDRVQNQLAREYWLLDPNGGWIFSLSDLKEKYGIATSSISKTVRKTCSAHSQQIKCTGCQAPMLMETRKQYTNCLSYAFRNINIANREGILCLACEAEYQRRANQIFESNLRKEREAIESYVNNKLAQLQPQDYASASKTYTFLMYGLLASAGEAWKGNQLLAWTDYRPKLFAHQEETLEVYKLLQLVGWMSPSADSKRRAFTLENFKVINFNKTCVNWVIAPNVGSTSLLDIFPLLHDGLHHIENDKLCEIWYMVCLSELRVYFEKLHERFGFQSDGWTPLVEKNMAMLLHECSLAEAMGIVWSGFKSLVTARADINIKPYLIKNWIPGVFMRTLARHKGYGPLRQWDRPNRTDEAHYTSLLFDTVLDPASNPYATLRGADLE